MTCTGGRYLSQPASRSIILVLTISFYLYYGVYKMLFVHFELVGLHFLTGCIASNNFLDGRNMYEMPKGINPFFYPPLSLIIYLPLCLFGDQVAKACWFILSHAMVFGAAWLTYKICSVQNRTDALFAVLVSFGLSMPVQGLVLTGNINIFILLGLAGTFYALIAGKTNASCAALACFTWVKFYPAGLMLPFVWQQQWKAIRRYVIVVVALGVASVSIFGAEAHIAFLEQLSATYPLVSGAFQAVSFVYVVKLFVGEDYRQLVVLGNAIFTTALLYLLWMRSRRMALSEHEGARLFVDLSIMLVVIMLAVPPSWVFWQAFLVPLQSVILFLWLQDRRRFRFIGLYAVLCGFISEWEIIAYQIHVPTVGLTIYEIGQRLNEFPTLFPILYSIPFFFTAGVLAWLLLNYQALSLGVKTLAIAEYKELHT